jgi:hypothetical protein
VVIALTERNDTQHKTYFYIDNLDAGFLHYHE